MYYQLLSILSIFRVEMENMTEKHISNESESKNQPDEDYKNELRIQEELMQIYQAQKERIRQLKVFVIDSD